MLKYLKNRAKSRLPMLGVSHYISRRMWVAKILVADDNSNIQRMVGLALKDQGIDVVAVGNGEAAVRKISEIRPDLVLADVFMPVRNGYEVCQYVKEDPSLKHIPVILLVGAFDPLDEQEAQRVGADGVLKKPFVPPDPLIVMVKSALQRAGVSLGQADGGREKKIPATAPRKSADVLSFTPAPAFPVAAPPTQPPGSPLGGLSFSRTSTPEPIVVGDDSFVNSPTAPEPVKFDAAEQTMAFGELLGPTTAEATEFTSSYETQKTTSEWPEVDEPNEVVEEEEEEEEVSKEAKPSWRREENPNSSRGDDESGPVRDWRDLPTLPTIGRKSARETWGETGDKGGFITAAEVPADMGGFVTEIGTLESESLNAKTEDTNTAKNLVEEPSQTAFLEQRETFSGDEGAIGLAEESEFLSGPASVRFANHDEFVGQRIGEVANEVISEPLPEIAHLEEVARQDEVERQEEAARLQEIVRREAIAREEEAARQEELARQEAIAREEEAARQEELARREEAARQEEAAREEELARQEEFARLEETARQERIAREEENERQEEITRQSAKQAEPNPVNSWFSSPASPWDSDPKTSNPWAAALESAKTATTDAVENARTTNSPDSSNGSGNVSSDALAAVISDLSAAEVASTHPTATQTEVDEMVAKVLSKLSPEVMQAVTRELLKPVIASLVQDELKSKK
jgi:CheY-like chemotaxis protein